MDQRILVAMKLIGRWRYRKRENTYFGVVWIDENKNIYMLIFHVAEKPNKHNSNHLSNWYVHSSQLITSYFYQWKLF